LVLQYPSGAVQFKRIGAEKGDSGSGLELSNTGKPPAELLAFDFGAGKVKSLKSDDKKWRKRALCVRDSK
jgi:hypothetical protein